MDNKKNKKGAIVLIILLLPISFYLILTLGKHGFDTLDYVGESYEVTTTNDKGEEVTETIYHTIPDFSFVNQDGKVVTNKDYEGKVYVAEFFFTRCPDICKEMNSNMLEVQSKLKSHSDFAILSHTVDPQHDTVEVLKNYAERIGADTRNWNFVTGTKEALYDIAFSGYFVNADEDELAPGGFLHSSYFVIVDKEGHIRAGLDEEGQVRGVYDGTDQADIKALIEDVRVLISHYKLELKKNNKYKDGEGSK